MAKKKLKGRKRQTQYPHGIEKAMFAGLRGRIRKLEEIRKRVGDDPKLIRAEYRKTYDRTGDRRWAKRAVTLVTKHAARESERLLGKKVDPKDREGVDKAAWKNVADALRSVEKGFLLALSSKADPGARASIKANAVARETVSRTLSAATTDFFQKSGVAAFRWRSQRDNRVRPLHKDLHGQIFLYPKGHPVEGLPGDPFGCRCVAEPIVGKPSGGRGFGMPSPKRRSTKP